MSPNSINPKSTTEFVEIELQIYKSSYDGFQATLLLPWGEQVSQRLDPPPLNYLQEALGGIGQTAGPNYYGRLLMDWLTEREFQTAYRKLREFGLSADKAVRLRVGFSDNMEDLLALKWESLFDEWTGLHFSLDGPFTRFSLSSPPLLLEEGWPLRILVMVANPTGAAAFTDEQLGQVTAVFEEVATPSGQAVTKRPLELMIAKPDTWDLARLTELRSLAGPLHGLVLLARSVTVDESSGLLLAGQTEPIAWDDVVSAILPPHLDPPSLVFLGIPTSDPTSDAGASGRLAPAILKRRVGAVVSCGGRMSIGSLVPFLKEFAAGVLSSGQLDTAVLAARQTLYSASPASWDWTEPVLFTQARDAAWFHPVTGGLETMFRATPSWKIAPVRILE